MRIDLHGGIRPELTRQDLRIRTRRPRPLPGRMTVRRPRRRRRRRTGRRRCCRPPPAGPSCLPRGRPAPAAAARHHVGHRLEQIPQQPHAATITGQATAQQVLSASTPPGRVRRRPPLGVPPCPPSQADLADSQQSPDGFITLQSARDESASGRTNRLRTPRTVSISASVKPLNISFTTCSARAFASAKTRRPQDEPGRHRCIWNPVTCSTRRRRPRPRRTTAGAPTWPSSTRGAATPGRPASLQPSPPRRTGCSGSGRSP